MIEFNCPECNKQIKVKTELAGRTGKCPGCGNKILVPQASSLTKVETPKPVIVRPQSVAKPAVRPPEVPQPIQPWSLPQQVQPQPTTAIQVNVNNTKATNSLGISSLILGILSFFVCWLPVIGFALSGLGLLLGLGGIAMSVFRKGTGIGYSIAGAAVNSIALLIGIIFITVFASAVASVDSTMKRLEAERNKVAQQAKPVPPQQAIPAPASSDATGEAPTTPEVTIPEAPKPEPAKPTIVYNPATEALQLGDVQLKILEVKLGKVELTQMFSQRDSTSADELLMVKVQITNTSSTKKLDYRGWMESLSNLQGITAKLTDENENRNKTISFPASASIKGATSKDSIYPGKSIVDAIVFEIPIENAKQLFLTLAAKGCQQDGEFRFEIPKAMIQR